MQNLVCKDYYKRTHTHMHMCAHAHAHTHTHTHTHTHAHTHIYTHTHSPTHTNTHTHTQTHTGIHTDMHTAYTKLMPDADASMLAGKVSGQGPTWAVPGRAPPGCHRTAASGRSEWGPAEAWASPPPRPLPAPSCDHAASWRGPGTQNSEHYYTRLQILSSCLLLQSIPGNLHANTIHIKAIVTTLTTTVMMKKVIILKSKPEPNNRKKKEKKKAEIRTLSQTFAIEFWDSSTKLQSLPSKMPWGISDFWHWCHKTMAVCFDFTHTQKVSITSTVKTIIQKQTVHHCGIPLLVLQISTFSKLHINLL